MNNAAITPIFTTSASHSARAECTAPIIAVVYVATCVVTSAVCLFGGLGTVSQTTLLWIACFLVALLGVPHGGLDHWIGRRLLVDGVGQGWAVAFFGGYLLLGATVAFVWCFAPQSTILAFLFLSSWHFGREESREQPLLAAIATGGILIWSIALLRPQEMVDLLTLLQVYPESGVSASIVNVVSVLATVLLPIGIVSGLPRLAREGQFREFAQALLVRVATVVVAWNVPILLSFAIYFCFWHSLLGLQKLRKSEGLSLARFAVCVVPLSLLAVAIVVLAAWGMGGFAWGRLAQDAALLRMLFIGLAAIAVPHIVLHECERWLQELLTRRSMRLSWETLR